MKSRALVCVCVHALVLAATVAAAQPAPFLPKERLKTIRDDPLTVAEVERAVAAIQAARSVRGARNSVAALQLSGDQGYARLAELIDSDSVHPEVIHYIARRSLNPQNPFGEMLALRFLREADRSLQRMAARHLASMASPDALDALLQAARATDDVDTLAALLMAISRTARPTAAVPYLASFLKKDALSAYSREERDMILTRVVAGLGALRATEYAPAAVALLDESWPESDRNQILFGVHAMYSSDPDPERILTAAKPGSGLERYAMHRLHHLERFTVPKDDSGRPTGVMVVEPTLERQIEATRTGMRSADPLTRALAVNAYMNRHTLMWTFVTEHAPVEVALALLDDPSPYVRRFAIKAQHETILRRGLMIPGRQAEPLLAETIKMLRFPVDWIIFPRFVDAIINDPSEDVRVHAAWMLGISTGYHHGWENLDLKGMPQLTDTVKQRWKAMVEEMSEHTARSYTVAVLDDRLRRLAANERPDLHGQWMKGVQLLTGRKYGYKKAGPAGARRAAIGRAQAWWAANRDGHPGDWQMSAILESAGGPTIHENLYFLARWSQNDFPYDVFPVWVWKDDPAAAKGRLTRWWKTERPELESR